MGQRWEYLVDLLINAEYLSLKKSDIEIRKMKWENLRLSQQGGIPIQITSHHPKNQKKTRYVCKGIPRYKGPPQQSKDAIFGRIAYMEIRLPTRTDAALNSKLKQVYIMHHVSMLIHQLILIY